MINNTETQKGSKKEALEEVKKGCINIGGESEEAKMCEIQKEFTNGIEKVLEFDSSVTFYGSAIITEDHPSYKQAQHLAYRISKELNYAILSGGGGGVMEAANRGASEAGGKSVGLTIRLPHEQKTNKYVTDEIPFNFFFTRKTTMSYATEVCIFCPGGYGTFDELFETLTLQQTNKIARFPIILLGVSFWEPIIKVIKEVLLDKYSTITPADLEYFTITDDEDQIMEIIKSSKKRDGADELI